MDFGTKIQDIGQKEKDTLAPSCYAPIPGDENSRGEQCNLLSFSLSRDVFREYFEKHYLY